MNGNSLSMMKIFQPPSHPFDIHVCQNESRQQVSWDFLIQFRGSPTSRVRTINNFPTPEALALKYSSLGRALPWNQSKISRLYRMLTATPIRQHAAPVSSLQSTTACFRGQKFHTLVSVRHDCYLSLTVRLEPMASYLSQCSLSESIHVTTFPIFPIILYNFRGKGEGLLKQSFTA